MQDPIFEALADSSWFASLGSNLGSRLRVSAQTRRFMDNDAIYRQGDTSDGIYAVLEGTARLTSYSDEGTAHVQLLARRGDWFGEVSTLDAGPRQQDAVSEGAVFVLHVPMIEIDRIAAAEPQLWRAIGRLATLHQRAALGYLQAMVATSAEDRVVSMIKILEGREPGTRLRITHEEIAVGVGLSRQTVTTILQRLCKKGVVELGYRSIALTRQLTSSHPK